MSLKLGYLSSATIMIIAALFLISIFELFNITSVSIVDWPTVWIPMRVVIVLIILMSVLYRMFIREIVSNLDTRLPAPTPSLIEMTVGFLFFCSTHISLDKSCLKNKL